MIKLKYSLNKLVYFVFNYCDDLFFYMLGMGNYKVLLKIKMVKGFESEMYGELEI